MPASWAPAMMTGATLSPLWHSAALWEALLSAFDMFFTCRKQHSAMVPLTSHVSKVLACPYITPHPKQQILPPLNAST